MMRTSLKLLVFGGGVAYLLQDLFNTALAAGSVNGTLADTGQTRTVTDTNSKMAIIAGQLNVVTGGSAEMNPAIFWLSFVRVAGVVLLYDFPVNGSSVSGMTGGWFTAAANISGNTIRPLLGTQLGVRANGTFIAVAADLGFGIVTYKCAVILRATGSYHFIKGGVYTNWTLLWINPNGNTSPMFAGIGVVATTSVGNIDNARVPSALYIPPVLAYDTFTRADGALGSTEATGPDSQSATALAWVFTAGVWTISTNKAIATPTPGSDVIVNGAFAADTDWTKGAGWTISSGTANASAASANLTAIVAPLTANRFYLVVYTLSAFAAGTVQVVIGGKSMPTHAANATYTEIGLATTTALLFTGAGFTGSLDNVSAKALAWADVFATVACTTADIFIDAAATVVGATSGLPEGIVTNLDSTSNPQNFVLVYFDGNANVVIAEMVAGTITVKQTTAVTYSAGAVLRVERSGTECRAFYNNAAVGSAQTMTANTNKNHGGFDPTALNSLDNITIWARGTSNEYTTLDIY